ncbi:MAG: hypothetical protein GY757_00005 [bacterium]|nr:hypothetical protein [bacterium]
MNAAMAGNESEGAFGGNSKTNYSLNDNVPTLKHLIVEGGGYFFQSSAAFHQLLSQYELSEIKGADFNAMKMSLKTAVVDLERAHETYRQLKDLAYMTPYNQEVIDKLFAFKYFQFREARGLVPVIFRDVWRHLVFGDVRGVYEEFHYRTGQILETLTAIQKDVDAGIMPDLDTLWRINQEYAEFKLFGQYVAEVFYNL